MAEFGHRRSPDLQLPRGVFRQVGAARNTKAY